MSFLLLDVAAEPIDAVGVPALMVLFMLVLGFGALLMGGVAVFLIRRKRRERALLPQPNNPNQS